jgi:hypothetical protein
MIDAAFLPDALDVNRGGSLSDAQLDDLTGMIARTHDGLAGLIGRRVDPIYSDTRAGRVECAEGAITKHTAARGSGGATPGTRYEIRVNAREGRTQIFHTSRSLYEYAPQASLARLFYLPRSHWVVNLEALPDPPGGDLGGQSKADVIVRAGAYVREVESYLPDAASARPPASTEAIVWNWTSPFGTVSFGADARFTALLSDGSEHHGDWSVAADGRLHADIMSAPIVADATVSGDTLTLVMDGQALPLAEINSSSRAGRTPLTALWNSTLGPQARLAPVDSSAPVEVLAMNPAGGEARRAHLCLEGAQQSLRAAHED